MLCISCLSSVVGVNTKLLIEYSMNKFSLQMCSLFNILSFNVLPLFHLYTFLANGLLWHIGCIDLLGLLTWPTYLTYLAYLPAWHTKRDVSQYLISSMRCFYSSSGSGQCLRFVDIFIENDKYEMVKLWFMYIICVICYMYAYMLKLFQTNPKTRLRLSRLWS